MSKYIIKNCPAYNDMPNIFGEVYGYCDNEHDIDLNKCMCENITDCVLKQIVEKCKNYKESCKIEGNCLDERLCSTCFLGGANELGEWIFDDLDIQEVE